MPSMKLTNPGELAREQPQAAAAFAVTTCFLLWYFGSAKRRLRLRLRVHAALAEVALALRRSRLPLIGGGACRPPQPGDRVVSAPWLTGVLHSVGSLPKTSSVLNVVVEDIEGHRGLGSIVVRLRLTYDTEVGPSAPRTLILKTNRTGYKLRVSALALGQHREGQFLRDFGKRIGLQQVLPKLYYAHGSSLTGVSVTLLEDLQPGTIGVNLLLGNQVWGVPDTIPDAPDRVTVLREVYTRAAEMHAPHWNDATLLRRDWLKGCDWYNGRGRAAWELAVERTRSDWAAVKRREKNGWTLSPDLVRVIDASLAQTSWAALQRKLRDRSVPFTLCHGDFHASNMLWRTVCDPDAARVVWIDWTEVGVWEPAGELGQTIISDVRPELWGHNRELVRAYYTRLQELGVALGDFTFERLWERFERAPVERWIWMFVLLANWPQPLPGNAMQYFHDQLLTFIKTHGDHASYPMSYLAVIM